MSELTEPEFDVDQQPQEEIDVEEQGNLLWGIVICTTKGQLISECLFDNLKFSKKKPAKFDKFLPYNIKSGKINKIKAPSYNI